MISTTNDYSLLKWPSVTVSVFITLVAFILLLCFQSKSWFAYESFDTNDKSIISDTTIKYPRSLEYGSFGLWSLCIGHYIDQDMKCESWISQTRPDYFSVLVVLTSCALFLANLSIFPTWAATILILYNVRNCYIRHIVVCLWIILFLSLVFTCTLICALIIIGLTKYYSPGRFFIGSMYISFETGSGIYGLLIATILAAICLILIFISLIWKKFIELKLIEEEKELYRQLTDESYIPSWHRAIPVPRASSTDDERFGEPPPYKPNYDSA